MKKDKKTLTHFDSAGQAHMVDIGHKPATERRAVAEGRISMEKSTFELIHQGAGKKGDVLGVARIAAIQGAKKTSMLIPLCHSLIISKVHIEFLEDPSPSRPSISCRASVHCLGQTGVEMEALTAVAVSLLTIYDMCKAVDKFMTIGPIQLVEKSGGSSGAWQKKLEQP